MDISHVDFFVLDEADKLMEDVFTDDINYVINSLPPVRQVAVFSATYPRNLDTRLSTFLRDAALVRFNADDVQLVGIKQYVVTKCSPMLEKLTHVLKSKRFVQALVFCDQITKCQPIAAHLKSEGLDVTFVSSAMSQKERQLAVDQLRMNRVKILVSSDLTARGIDADNVNLVVNVDAAANEETYFHRIGRAARFGAHGAAVTLLEDEKALKCFTALTHKGKVRVKTVENVEMLPEDLTNNQEFWNALPFFFDFGQRSKSRGNNDLDEVPDRKTAIKTLQEERESTGVSTSSKKYNREKMMALRELASSVKGNSFKSENSGEICEKKKNLIMNDDENGNEQVEESMKIEETIQAKKSFNERLVELKAVQNKIKKVKNQEKENEEVVMKPKFKFVPTREKSKKKYFMRGELQHIRNCFNADQWRAYAETKFDMSQEPFVGRSAEESNSSRSSAGIEKNTIFGANDVSKSLKNNTNSKKKGKSVVTSTECASKIQTDTIKYSRYQMKQIQREVPKNSWIPYVKSKWDTTEEPWELDPTMRCPFEERLRRIRKKEKDERKKVIEERKKKREKDRSELVSIGRITQPVEIKEASWEDYQQRVLKDFEDKAAKWKKEEQGGSEKSLTQIGPVVPQRTPPHIYRYRIDMYKQRLREQDAWLIYEYKLDVDIIRDVEVQTGSYEHFKKFMEMECQTDEVEFKDDLEEECDDEEYWNEEDEYCDEEYDDEEEECVKDATEQNLNQLQHIQLMELGAGYIRNVHFQAASQSYIDLMNSMARNRRN